MDDYCGWYKPSGFWGFMEYGYGDGNCVGGGGEGKGGGGGAGYAGWLNGSGHEVYQTPYSASNITYSYGYIADFREDL